MAFKIRCPVCRQTFPFDASSGFPDLCPNDSCQSRIASDRSDDEICMPSIRTLRTATLDRTYRDMEVASEVRARQAASELNVPVHEVSDLKITDLRDARRQGDVAAVPVVNDVTREMDRIAAHGGSVGFQPNGAQYSGAVSSGPTPNAGARTQLQVRDFHAKTAGWDKISSQPPLETLQPGYRSRV